MSAISTYRAKVLVQFLLIGMVSIAIRTFEWFEKFWLCIGVFMELVHARFHIVYKILLENYIQDKIQHLCVRCCVAKIQIRNLQLRKARHFQLLSMFVHSKWLQLVSVRLTAVGSALQL